MTFRSLLLLILVTVVSIGLTTQAIASEHAELEKARACMKCGHTEEGFSTLHKLAEKGHPTAQCLVGVCYQHGKGVQTDGKEAKRWYEKSARQGFPDAEARLGKMYLNGAEIEKDAIKAEYWLTKAAKHDVAEAQYDLGKLYIKENNAYNKNINKRMMAGRRWILLARDRGVEDTEKLLDQIPGFDQVETTIASKVHQSGLNASQGVGNIESSWEGYGDMVKTLHDINSTAAQ